MGNQVNQAHTKDYSAAENALSGDGRLMATSSFGLLLCCYYNAWGRHAPAMSTGGEMIRSCASIHLKT